uniref:TPR_REGION domain-containing protein n=1 Tax=Trichobilharzia regenti TaxID=157069 RepID=A0AA85J8E0_TRIRE|nr:unnamed protein product [Trichobilharzia regenti]
MDPSLDYPQIYKSLSNDVKKKLNERNKSDDQAHDFACVAKSLASQECHSLAAVFLLGKARCEFGAKNVTAEASTLFTAAKYFIQADDKYTSMNAVNYEDNLDCAILCLLRSARIYELNELFTLATNVYIYLVDLLMRLCKYNQAIPYLKRTMEIVSKDILLSLELYKRLSHCQLCIHDWPGALSTFIRIQCLLKEEFTAHSFDLYVQYWSYSEIFRVLLILLCMPPYKLCSHDTSGYSLKQYTLDIDCQDTEDEGTTEQLLLPSPMKSAYIDEELFILLQSFVLAHRIKDIVELEKLSVMLQSF